MIKKFSSLLHREWTSPYESALLMGLFAIFTQVLILSRDRLLAHYFGAGQTLDIYFAASRIPDLLFVLAASTMAASVFFPAIAKYSADSDERAQKFVSDTFSVVFTTMVLIVIGLMFAAPWISHAVYPQFNSADQAELVLVMRSLLLVPLFFALSTLLGSITLLLDRFVAFLIAPMLYSLGIAIGAILLFPAFGIVGLAGGAALGAFLGFFVHFFICARHGYFLAITWRPSYIDIWELIKSSFPRMIYFAVGQLTLLALFAFAARMESGSITIFALALSVQTVFLSVIGIPFTMSAFPGISKRGGEEDPHKFVGHVSDAARRIIFFLSLAPVYIVVLRAQLVRAVLGSGAFGWHATRLTIAALAIFSLSITAQALSLLFMRAFHTMKNKSIPFISSAISSLAALALAYGLIKEYTHSMFFRDFIETMFRVEGLRGAGVLMLPLAYSIGALLNSVILLYFFKKCFGDLFGENIRDTAGQATLASLIAGFVTYEFLVVLGMWLDLHTFKGIFLQGLGAGSAGILAWWLFLELMQNDDIKEFRRALGGKFRDAGVIPFTQEEI